MSDEKIIRHCAPTLASMKTGNLFTCAFSSREEMLESARSFNRRMCPRGLRAVPMRYANGMESSMSTDRRSWTKT